MAEKDYEEFMAALPRSTSTMGDDLAISEVLPDGTLIISDGKRSAVYAPEGWAPLEGKNLRIVPKYVGAGSFSEAYDVYITDGFRTARYLPTRIIRDTIQ